MFRQILTWSAAGASAAIALAMIAGLFAPLDPRFEIVNHFRPLLTAGALASLLLAALLRERRLAIASGAVSLASLALALSPLYFAAPSANGERLALRVVSLNLWVENRDRAASVEFLRASKADVILLQEVRCAPSNPLFAALRGIYPHIYRATERCMGQAILSKYPIARTGREDFEYRRPVWIWAEIALGASTVRVTGVHLSHPTRPFDQVKNIDALVAYARGVALPHIIAGDFNLTPHSWLLTRFARESGLRRNGTFQASWPGHRAVPLFLIDHVFTSVDFARADFTVAKRAGSDHRPVIADLVLRDGATAMSDRHRF